MIITKLLVDTTDFIMMNVCRMSNGRQSISEVVHVTVYYLYFLQ